MTVDSLITRHNETKPVDSPAAQPGIKRLSLKELSVNRVSHTTRHPAPTPVITIMGTNFANRGMISALTGPPKAGKTTVIGFMLATAFFHYADPSLSLGVETTFAAGRDVVYLDFDQHISSTQELQDKVLRYAGLSSTPPNLHVYNLLEYSLDQRREAIELCFREHDMHLLVIDGIADVLPGVNDEEKVNALIEDVAILASRYNTAVVVVIHENKGGGSVRGHLGSQIERKCAGLISIKKDRERRVHCIESRLIRIGDDFDTFYFNYSDDQNRMILCDATQTAQLKEAATAGKVSKYEDPEYLGGLMKLCFKEEKSLLKKALKEGIMKQANVGERSVDRYVNAAIKAGVLKTEDEGKTYAMTDEPPF